MFLKWVQSSVSSAKFKTHHVDTAKMGTSARLRGSTNPARTPVKSGSEEISRNISCHNRHLRNSIGPAILNALHPESSLYASGVLPSWYSPTTESSSFVRVMDKKDESESSWIRLFRVSFSCLGSSFLTKKAPGKTCRWRHGWSLGGDILLRLWKFDSTFMQYMTP